MSYELTINPLGQTIQVEEDQTILDAALRAGIWLPHACCHGLCATCKIQITDGEVDHGESTSFALMDFERDEGKALACCATLQTDLVIEADIDLDPDAEIIHVKDFSGVVTEIHNLSPTIKGIFIALDDPIHFQAGQYINLAIDGGRLTRAFSLATPPSQGQHIELNVRAIPGGEGTNWLHNHMKAGDRITLSGPYGRFFVRKSLGEPLIFMAGGSGLSSPRSMILDLLQDQNCPSITLVYGQRTLDELYYHEDFLEIAESHPQFSYVPALSDHDGRQPWDGFKGYVHEAAHAYFNGDFRNHKAYLCGPPLMIDACITTLMKGRLFEKDIYTEKFFSAADAQQLHSPLFKHI